MATLEEEYGVLARAWQEAENNAQIVNEKRDKVGWIFWLNVWHELEIKCSELFRIKLSKTK